MHLKSEVSSFQAKCAICSCEEGNLLMPNLQTDDVQDVFKNVDLHLYCLLLYHCVFFSSCMVVR